MMITKILFITIFMATFNALAEDEIFCEGGVRRGDYTSSVYLVPIHGGDHFEAVLKSQENRYFFHVSVEENGYRYIAKLGSDEYAVIDDFVSDIRSEIEAPLDDQKTIYLKCRAYKPIDFCRIHTCLED